MTETPHSFFLPREKAEAEIKQCFGPQLEVLEEMVSYASNLIPRVYATSEKKVHDLVIIHNFVKQSACLLDGIHILACRGAVVDGMILVRSLIEVSFQLEWLFQKNTAERGLYYYVYHLREKRLWLFRVLTGSKENLAYVEAMKGSPVEGADYGLTQERIQEDIANINAVLTSQQYYGINARFDAARNGWREWYAPELQNLRSLAKEIGKEASYVAFFAPYSNFTHGLALDNHVSFAPGEVGIGPMRNVVGLDQLLTQTYLHATIIFRLVLGYYRPDEAMSFNRKLLKEWHHRTSSMPLVEDLKNEVRITQRPAPPLPAEIQRKLDQPHG